MSERSDEERLTVIQDDDRSEQYEVDPRWEIQPEPYQEHEAGRDARGITLAFVVLAVCALVTSLAVWSLRPVL